MEGSKCSVFQYFGPDLPRHLNIIPNESPQAKRPLMSNDVLIDDLRASGPPTI